MGCVIQDYVHVIIKRMVTATHAYTDIGYFPLQNPYSNQLISLMLLFLCTFETAFETVLWLLWLSSQVREVRSSLASSLCSYNVSLQSWLTISSRVCHHFFSSKLQLSRGSYSQEILYWKHCRHINNQNQNFAIRWPFKRISNYMDVG